MRKLATAIILLGLVTITSLYAARQLEKTTKKISYHELKDGDIIFQRSESRQCQAVQIVTKSDYSHCGMIYKKGSEVYVLEAVQPVVITQIDKWIARGQNKHYVVKRLANADSVLTPAMVAKMKKIGSELLGKDYDFTFEWSDDKIYCSELVWKIYKRASGIEVGKLQTIKDFDLTHPLVAKIVKERYGDNVPMEETVISPASIFESKLLVTVESKK